MPGPRTARVRGSVSAVRAADRSFLSGRSRRRIAGFGRGAAPFSGPRPRGGSVTLEAVLTHVMMSLLGDCRCRAVGAGSRQLRPAWGLGGDPAEAAVPVEA